MCRAYNRPSTWWVKSAFFAIDRLCSVGNSLLQTPLSNPAPPTSCLRSSLSNIHLALGLQIMKSWLNMYICSKFIQSHAHLSSLIYGSFISHTLDDSEQIYLLRFTLTKRWYYSLRVFHCHSEQEVHMRRQSKMQKKRKKKTPQTSTMAVNP